MKLKLNTLLTARSAVADTDLRAVADSRMKLLLLLLLLLMNAALMLTLLCRYCAVVEIKHCCC
jgi:hypothetical protein